MKKSFHYLIGLMMVLGLVLIPAPMGVYARADVDESYTPAWVFPLDPAASFQTVSVEAAAENAPAWLQLFSDGLRLSQPTKICYTFRYGQFNWVPKFLQLKSGVWTTLTTTSEYLYGEEGNLYACAKPIEAGTYALFAYYKGPAEAQAPQGSALFTVGSWEMTVGTDGRPDDFGFIYANDVNWQGYSNAARLGWGIEMCWPGDGCRYYEKGSVSISPDGYPQNYDVTILDEITWSFSGSGGECRMAPYVDLLDSGGNTLIRIYFESASANRCVS
jgi:hypothetical protein